MSTSLMGTKHGDEPAEILHERMKDTLSGLAKAAVAVSGGVDSLTLATLCHRELGGRAHMLHAMSPAVPPRATERVQRLAAQEGWHLKIFDAGEFADARYLANPVDRCFFCKGHLYQGIRERFDGPIFSGTNRDDLSDYRPGLVAARENGVRHPFVEAGVDKAGVRALARLVGLGELSELPSSPCLSSRVETGVGIDPRVLSAIDLVEEKVRRRLGVRTVRCRVRRREIEIELDGEALSHLAASRRQDLAAEVRHIFSGLDLELDPEPTFSAYRRGSAFLRPAIDG